jgi:LacI family transcriptional regulator
MKVTLADVAEKAGVSLATASRVINNSSHNVTGDLRARVLSAVAALNYVPNAHARALVQDSTSVVGVIVHDVSDPYFSEITGGIQRVATDAGKLLIICNSYRDVERELDYVAMLRSQSVDAMIFAGSGRNDESFTQRMATQIKVFTASGGQVAFIGRHDLPGDMVIPDNRGGGQAIGRLLLELGHRNIGIIKGPSDLTTVDDRLTGFQAALAKANLTIPPENIAQGDFSRGGGVSAATELLQRNLPITAIFALNDPMAVGALSVLRDQNVRVPDDLSVVGFDDIAVAQDVTPTLTTVRVDMAGLGRRAMEMVLNPSPVEGVYRTAKIPTEVLVRGSTARIDRAGSRADE